MVKALIANMQLGFSPFIDTINMQTIVNDVAAMQAKNLLNTGVIEDLPEDDLNPQQRDAVNCKSRIIYVNAGPGTGKTHLLTSKLVEYIQASNTPQKIVALSYTNTAANHIGEKFKEKADKAGIAKEYTFYYGTLHSFCYSLLRAYNKGLEDEQTDTILDDEELFDLAEEICIQSNKKYPTKIIESALKSRLNADDDLAQLVAEYKKKYRVISTHDILSDFISKLVEDVQFQHWIKEHITAIAVDEAQDLSEENYIILDKLLTLMPKVKLFLVGDPRQNIFEFNGGSYRNLEGFLSQHQQYSTKYLTLTYRCGQAIVDYVNGFSFTDCDNTQLQSRCKDAGHITIKRCSSEETEAIAVCEELRNLDLNDTAVLCNNLKYMNSLMVKLQAFKIPYKVLGGRRILKQHVKLLKHVLRIIESENEYSIRKVGEAAKLQINQQQTPRKTAKEQFYESAIGMKILAIREDYFRLEQTTHQVLQNVIEQVMSRQPEGSSIDDDYKKILDLSYHYESLSDFLLSFATDKESFAEFFQKDYVECTVPVDDTYLTISTIHSAKGLEWKNVFIMGLSEGNFPNGYFCQGKPKEVQDEYYNGELKKMYVAATRAKEQLFLTYATSLTRKGYTFSKRPSRFISNLESRPQA